MKNIAKMMVALGLTMLILSPGVVRAQKSVEELQKETVAACAASAKDKITVEKIKEMVEKACVLLEKDGTAAFPKFKGKDSAFIFCGTYIWVNDLKGKMLLHPAIPQMEGMDLLNVKDGQGKRLFVEFNKMAKDKGAGWVDYWWPKPGDTAPSRKLSFVKLCNVKGTEMVVGSGVYDLPDDQVDKLLMAQKTAKELAKETEKATAQSDINMASPQLVMSKVKQACTLLEQYGKSAFPQFKGKHSEFIFAGTYVWVHDFKGIMRMHPIQADMEGKEFMGWKDSHGKLIFVEFNKVANEKGAGWVDYWWPKPGQKESKEGGTSHKVSFVKKAKIDGEDMVVGCGIYDLREEDIARLVKEGQ